MAEIGGISIIDAATLELGVVLEAAAIWGAVEVVRSNQDIIQKVAELGALGVIGFCGACGIGYGIDRIRDSRHNRAVHSVLED